MGIATNYAISSDLLEHFEDYTCCPTGLTDALCKGGGNTGDWDTAAAGLRSLTEVRQLVDRLVSSTEAPPRALDDAINELRLESYIDNSVEQVRQSIVKRALRETYYKLRPAFPVAFRKYIQRMALRGWDSRPFPAWPVDTSVERLIATLWRRLLQSHDVNELPFIWFWPEGKASACIMTHDVETEAGRDFCTSLMKMESRFGIVSAFEVVPEERYAVPKEFLQSIRDGGCEVCIHGLNHDGRDFNSQEIFRSRVHRIRQFAEDWQVIGFRAPVMYRNLSWLPELGFSYDMSVPNVGHLDPQPGGCCTVMPYFIGPLLELPLTTIQDYSLFNILEDRSMRIWEAQIQRVTDAAGLLSFIIHPDYVNQDWSSAVYTTLLERLARLRDDSNVWLALPREVDSWWRTRRNLKLVKAGPEWRIVGVGAEKARVASALLENGTIRYRILG